MKAIYKIEDSSGDGIEASETMSDVLELRPTGDGIDHLQLDPEMALSFANFLTQWAFEKLNIYIDKNQIRR